MTEEDFINYCKEKYSPFVGEAGITVGNYLFTLDGRISITVNRDDGNNPTAVWVSIAKNRTLEQMKQFLEAVL